MARGGIYHTLTEKRRAWLELLRDHSPAPRRSRVGYDCMILGWTEWVSSAPHEDQNFLEQITDAGRAVLDDQPPHGLKGYP